MCKFDYNCDTKWDNIYLLPTVTILLPFVYGYGADPVHFVPELYIGW